jgi:hypothetical protein
MVYASLTCWSFGPIALKLDVFAARHAAMTHLVVSKL